MARRSCACAARAFQNAIRTLIASRSFIARSPSDTSPRVATRWKTRPVRVGDVRVENVPSAVHDSRAHRLYLALPAGALALDASAVDRSR